MEMDIFYCLYYENEPSFFIHFPRILHNDVWHLSILNLISIAQLNLKNRRIAKPIILVKTTKISKN